MFYLLDEYNTLNKTLTYPADDIRNFQVFFQLPDQMHPLHWSKVKTTSHLTSIQFQN